MGYILSTEKFKTSKMFDSKGKFYHKSGNQFKLFPFVTQPNSAPVLELSPLVGNFLCRIEEKIPKCISVSELVEMLKADTEIEPGREDLFYDMIRQLFFFSDGSVRPLNLQLLEQITCSENSENRIAEYIVDVLGRKKELKKHLEKANQQEAVCSNVLERLVLSKLSYDQVQSSDHDVSYYRVTNSLLSLFESDFEYIIGNQNRSREYLIPLLEWYFFAYTAQASLQLNRFFDGERDTIIPLYFCLEWEKTSQSRPCFTEGWQKLQNAIGKIFAHAVVLEILNQTEDGSESVDYIRLAELIHDPDEDGRIAFQIDELTDCYRNAITDCIEMNELEKLVGGQSLTVDAVKYLFDSVRTQFENSVRVRAYNSYAHKFESYCHKYLKNRGRSGLMLNLSEETLIFITKLCIKDQERMRLKDVFDAFEARGIYLDMISKEQVANYYEKINLIEKKSDSGDAKYVKRIL